MKINLSLFFLLMIFETTAVAQTAHPVITLDDAHNHIKPGADKSTKYTVKAAKGIVVDATGYDYTNMKKYLDGNLPDKIFLVCESGTYVTAFNTEGQTVIEKATLTPFIGNTAFTRFQSGDTPIIAVGTVKMQGKQAKMAQVWATTIEVK